MVTPTGERGLSLKRDPHAGSLRISYGTLEDPDAEQGLTADLGSF